MQKTGQSYSSGEWSVRTSSEEEFIERWTTFIEWSLNNAKGAESSRGLDLLFRLGRFEAFDVPHVVYVV